MGRYLSDCLNLSALQLKSTKELKFASVVHREVLIRSSVLGFEGMVVAEGVLGIVVFVVDTLGVFSGVFVVTLEVAVVFFKACISLSKCLSFLL